MNKLPKNLKQILEALDRIIDRTNYLLDSHGGDMKAQEADYNFIIESLGFSENEQNTIT